MTLPEINGIASPEVLQGPGMKQKADEGAHHATALISCKPTWKSSQFQ